jgi:hypothetical protein
MVFGNLTQQLCTSCWVCLGQDVPKDAVKTRTLMQLVNLPWQGGIKGKR